MAKPDFQDAFNDCIDRLNAGESVESCVRQYPEYAERLRQLLGAGQLVYRARIVDAEVRRDQDALRDQIISRARQTKTQRLTRSNTSRWVFPVTAVAALLVVAIGVLALLGPAVGNIFSNVVRNLNPGSAPLEQALVATNVLAPIVTATPQPLAIIVTATPPPGDMIVATSVALMSPEPSQVSPRLSATPLPTTTVTVTSTPPGTAAPFGTTLPTLGSLPIIDATQAFANALLTQVSANATPTYDIAILTTTPAPLTGDSVALTVTGWAPLLGQGGTAIAMSLATPTLPPLSLEGIPLTATALAVQLGQDGTQVAMTTWPTGTPTPAPLDGSNVALTATALAFLLGQGGATPAPTPAGPAVVLLTSTPFQLIPLQAGEIDDNARWDQYLTYRSNYLQRYRDMVRDVDVSNRQIITVTDAQGLPLLGAQVQVYAWQTLVSDTRTYANGQTLFFPNATDAARGQQSYRVVVTAQNSSVEFTLDPQRGPLWNINLSQQRPASTPKLDVLFLLDATGSMADEIAQLQNNILAISSQIADLPGNADVRYGLVVYRDRGDAYVTEQYDFVPNVGDFQARLSGVVADGGGDTPESLNEALHEAVQNVTWRGTDTVKLIFLVADAAPHLDYQNDFDYTREMAEAARKGIKIHPIASSGLTPDGEFIFRQIAQYTMGHFIFLTYEQGGSGAPGEARPDLSVGTPASPATGGQGDYSVEQLDELVLRLITDELAALDTPIEQRGGISPDLTSVTPPPQAGASVPPAPRLSLLLPVAFGMLIVSIVVGYTFRFRSPIERRKRKNDEFEIVEDE